MRIKFYVSFFEREFSRIFNDGGVVDFGVLVLLRLLLLGADT